MPGDLILKQVVATIDKRTTMTCLDAAGQIQPVDHDFDTLSGGFDAPPFHVHCRSLSVPWMSGFVNDQRSSANAEIKTRPAAQRRKGPDGYEGPLPPPPPVAPTPPPIRGLGEHLSAKDVEAFKGGSAMEHLIQNSDGTWSFTAERQALHEELVRDALRGKVAKEEPTFYVLGGGPAAGKTTLIRSGLVPELKDASERGVLIANDDLKPFFPEYAKMSVTDAERAAPFVHEEAAYVTRLIRDGAMDARYDVVLDGTGDSSLKAITAKIEQARGAGYKVDGYYVTVPTDVAQQRALRRAIDTGRHMPETVLRETHEAVSRLWEDVVPLFDRASLYDTEGEVRLIYRSVLGKKGDVLEKALYRSFLDKGLPSDPASTLKGLNPSMASRSSSICRRVA